MKHTDLKEKLLANPETARNYNEMAEEFALLRQELEAKVSREEQTVPTERDNSPFHH